jgi:DNA polymerase/3'-5' exonuclease PolX
MSEKVKYPASVAQAVAEELVVRLHPACERLLIAGSLRRGKELVGDVELVFVPKLVVEPVDLLSVYVASRADGEISRMLEDGTLTKRPNKLGGYSWGEKNKLAVHVASGVPVDLFRTSEENWWNCVVLRTGSAESNTRIATEAQRRGWAWNPYGPGFTNLRDGRVEPMGSERAVFEFVGMDYREPWARE